MMKFSYFKHFLKKELTSRQLGFTLLEILIAMSVISILSAVSLAAFVSSSRSQQLQQATNDVMSIVKQAKSYSQSQVKPEACEGKTLEGYRVEYCDSLCADPNSYTIQVRCGGQNIALLNDDEDPYHLSNATISQAGSMIFHIQSNIVTSGESGHESEQQEYYDIVLNNDSGTKTIRVTNYGSISIL